MAPLHGDAVEVLAGTDRHQRETGHSLEFIPIMVYWVSLERRPHVQTVPRRPILWWGVHATLPCKPQPDEKPRCETGKMAARALLGRVDELFDDNPHGDEMNQSQKGLTQFLIPRGNASKLLEVVEEPFHLLT